MKLSDQCCTLEQGKRLVELGVKAEATFWWMPAKDGPHGEYIQYGRQSDALAPAYNVGELGELLPTTSFLKHGRTNNPWEVTKINGNGPLYWHVECTENILGPWPTEAQARAELLIYLLERKLNIL